MLDRRRSDEGQVRSHSLPTVVVALLTASLLGTAPAPGGWEMRACAHPNDWPFSSVERQGFENRIAAVLAEELGARLELVWTPTDFETPQTHLWTGACDLILGIGGGGEDLLHTLPYYRAPFTFVYRVDSSLDITSLDDLVGSDLRIATYPDSIVDRVLGGYGLRDRTVYFPPVEMGNRLDFDTPILEAVLDGEVDVGIVYGPVAGYYAAHETDALRVVAVSPELAPPMSPMFREAVVGVRPGDTAFRDRLNRALAARWEDIQRVLDEYGVPTLALPAPAALEPPAEDVLRVGVVLPLPTGAGEATDVIANAARIGAQVAEDLLGREAAELGFQLQVLMASAPDADASRRAAERLVMTDDVVALVGGVTDQSSDAIREVAEVRDVLFFNVGSADQDLRDAMCSPNTFHVEASESMYVDAILGWFGGSRARRWVLVHETTPRATYLAERIERGLGSLGADQGIARVSVDPGSMVFTEAAEAIDAASADLVVLLLPPNLQEAFLAQFRRRSGVAVTGLPHPIMQSRSYLQRLRQVTDDVGADVRIALWDTALREHGAEALNEAFVGRSGETMDPTGWSTFAALKVLVESVHATGSDRAEDLRTYLESDAARFDVYKGVPLSFRAWDHQLRQPLYAVRHNAAVEWGRPVSDRIAFAEVVGVIPDLRGLGEAGVDDVLDALGSSREESACDLPAH